MLVTWVSNSTREETLHVRPSSISTFNPLVPILEGFLLLVSSPRWPQMGKTTSQVSLGILRELREVWNCDDWLSSHRASPTSESSTCYLAFGGGCKWLNAGTATVQVNADHYDFTHADYGFSTGQDLTGKTISWTVEGCPDYSCTLTSSTTSIRDPQSGNFYPMTITACRDGTRSPAFFSEQIAGESALSMAQDCTSDTDADCNTTFQYTNIQWANKPVVVQLSHSLSLAQRSVQSPHSSSPWALFTLFCVWLRMSSYSNFQFLEPITLCFASLWDECRGAFSSRRETINLSEEMFNTWWCLSPLALERIWELDHPLLQTRSSHLKRNEEKSQSFVQSRFGGLLILTKISFSHSLQPFHPLLLLS